MVARLCGFTRVKNSALMATGLKDTGWARSYLHLHFHLPHTLACTQLRGQAFPSKLYEILEGENPDIIGWTATGRGFEVRRCFCRSFARALGVASGGLLVALGHASRGNAAIRRAHARSLPLSFWSFEIMRCLLQFGMNTIK